MKKAKVFEIRTVRVELGYANYFRPCIITSSKPEIGLLLLSTKDYSERGQSFCILSSHPDFKATGLDATSYTVHPPISVKPNELGSRRGFLQNKLAQEFHDWLGLPD